MSISDAETPSGTQPVADYEPSYTSQSLPKITFKPTKEFIRKVVGNDPAITDKTIENWMKPGYLKALLDGDIRDDDVINNWLFNLGKTERRHYRGYDITNSIDLITDEDRQREVSLLTLKASEPRNKRKTNRDPLLPKADAKEFPEHNHPGSANLFIITDGEGSIVSDNLGIPIKKGDMIGIESSAPHGFRFKSAGSLEMISIQNPPIREQKTGVENFHELEPEKQTSRAVTVDDTQVTVDNLMPFVRKGREP